MGKKMKFPFLFKSTETTVVAAASWPWPACATAPKTLSFRANDANGSIYKTMNSAYLDDKTSTNAKFHDSADSFITLGRSFEAEQQHAVAAAVVFETSAVVSELIRFSDRDRLFFEPGETSSILEEAKSHDDFPYKDQSVSILAMESRDPLSDFRVSMAEMVEAHGLRDWRRLEELLTWYLRINGKANHGYVIGAFVDLLTHLPGEPGPSKLPANDEKYCSSSASSTATTVNSLTSPLSSSSSSCSSSISPCLSSLRNEDSDLVMEKITESSSSSSSCKASASSFSGV